MDERARARIAWVLLIAILALNVWVRGHCFNPSVRKSLGADLWLASGREGMALDSDEALFTYIGKRICRGDVLYRDLADNKPPATYYLFALAVALGGPNELAVRVLPIPLVLGTIVLVWSLARRLGGNLAATLAALLYAFASTGVYLAGEGATIGHAINFFSVASLALMMRPVGNPSRSIAWGAGACVAMASLFRQVAVVDLPLYAVVLLLRTPRQTAWRRLIAPAELVAEFAAVWGATVAVIALQGAGREAYEDFVVYASAMASGLPQASNAPPFLLRWFAGNPDAFTGELPWPFGNGHKMVWWGAGTWPIWLVAAVGLPWMALGKGRPGHKLVAGWTLAAWVQVALPGMFWDHYYLLPLPGVVLTVALLGSALCQQAARGVRDRRWRLAAASALCALLVADACGGMIVMQFHHYLFVPPNDISLKIRRNNEVVFLRQLGRRIGRDAEGRRDARLYVWGWQSPLYIYSGLDGVSREIFADFFMISHARSHHPLVKPKLDRIMRDLEVRPPEYVFIGVTPFPALQDYLTRHYRLTSVARDDEGLWVRKDLVSSL